MSYKIKTGALLLGLLLLTTTWAYGETSPWELPGDLPLSSSPADSPAPSESAAPKPPQVAEPQEPAGALPLEAPAWTGPDLGIVALDAKGEVRYDLGGLQLSPYEIVSTPSHIFNFQVSKDLTAAEQLALIQSLPWLMDSSYLPQIFTTRLLLYVRPQGEGLEGTLYDLQRLETDKLQVPTQSAGSWEELLRLALERQPAPDTQVALNIESGLYHLPQADHLSLSEGLYRLLGLKVAKKQHYQPCSVCFPQENPYLKMSSSDRRLTEDGIAQVQSAYTLSQDRQAIERVQKVGAKVLAGSNYPTNFCEFIVLNSSEAQALSVHQGPIFITTGLLQLLESDDELAAVLAHELAHIILNHSRSNRTRGTITNVLGTVARYTVPNYWAYLGAGQAANLLNKGFSREQEYDADRTAVFLTLAAGYKPQEFCHTLQKLDLFQKEAGRGFTIPWFSTHPNSQQRIKAVQKLCSQLEPLQKEIDYIEGVGDRQLGAALRYLAPQYLRDPSPYREGLRAYRHLLLPPPGEKELEG